MFSSIRKFFGNIKSHIKAQLKRLPPPDVLWLERRVYLAALKRLGDRVEKFEPEDLWLLEQISKSARIAEFAASAAGLGPEKAAAVREYIQDAWKMLGRADDLYDTYWNNVAAPFLEGYVDGSNKNGWVSVV